MSFYHFKLKIKLREKLQKPKEFGPSPEREGLKYVAHILDNIQESYDEYNMKKGNLKKKINDFELRVTFSKTLFNKHVKPSQEKFESISPNGSIGWSIDKNYTAIIQDIQTSDELLNVLNQVLKNLKVKLDISKLKQNLLTIVTLDYVV